VYGAGAAADAVYGAGAAADAVYGASIGWLGTRDGISEAGASATGAAAELCACPAAGGFARLLAVALPHQDTSDRSAPFGPHRERAVHKLLPCCGTCVAVLASSVNDASLQASLSVLLPHGCRTAPELLSSAATNSCSPSANCWASLRLHVTLAFELWPPVCCVGCGALLLSMYCSKLYSFCDSPLPSELPPLLDGSEMAFSLHQSRSGRSNVEKSHGGMGWSAEG
jgi:hypothetical protein